MVRGISDLELAMQFLPSQEERASRPVVAWDAASAHLDLRLALSRCLKVSLTHERVRTLAGFLAHWLAVHGVSQATRAVLSAHGLMSGSLTMAECYMAYRAACRVRAGLSGDAEEPALGTESDPAIVHCRFSAEVAEFKLNWLIGARGQHGVDWMMSGSSFHCDLRGRRIESVEVRMASGQREWVHFDCTGVPPGGTVISSDVPNSLACLQGLARREAP